MGNSVIPPGRAIAAGCLTPDLHPPQPRWTTPSTFPLHRAVEDTSAGGASSPDWIEPDKPSEQFIAEVKQSEAWKKMERFFSDKNEDMMAGVGEEEDVVDVPSIQEKIESYTAEITDKKESSDKEAIKANLQKLKERTGFPYTYCKKALEETNNDLEKAEEWLEKESVELGLDKLKKIGSRRSAEGVIGIAWEDRHAAMVEVNSESDFVSSNRNFHELVDVVAKTCLQHTKEKNPSPKTTSQVVLKAEELGKLIAADRQTLSDHVARAISLLGERLRLRRAALISTDASAHLAVLTHSSDGPAEFRDHGRVGAMMVYRAADYDATAQLSKHICQQIIGMNPKTLEPAAGADPESALLTQKFLRDPSHTVGEVGARAGLRVEHFIRFERGEPGDDADDLGTEPAKPTC